jgi:hypothetical protein
MANPPNSPIPATQPSTATAFKSINCPVCGAPITLRALGASVMVGCSSCRSQIDISKPEIQVIKKFQAAAQRFPLPLGARGTLRGQAYVIVGAMIRVSDGYSWHEFLLFNPYIGFRWLILDGGHWSLAQTVKDVSAITPSGPGLDYRGRSYRKYQAGTAVVDTVIGEFYWRVKVGDQAQTADFVAAPWMLSREKTPTEVTWSLIQYLDPEEIADAFHVPVPERVGIAPSQPCTPSEALASIKRFVIGALLLALVIQLATMLLARNVKIPIGAYVPPADHAQETVFGPLHFDAHRSLNELNAYSPLDNSWVELDYALVKKGTGESFEFGNAMEFYSGRDSDGAWSDGSRSASTLLSSLPQGDYDLVVDSASGNSSGAPPPQPIQLSLTHDVAPWRNFWLACAVILAYPLYLMYRRLIFERERWSDSQFDPYPRKTG